MLSARSNSLPSIVRQSWPCVPSLFCQLNLLLSGTEPSYFTPNPSGGSPFMSESIWRQKLLPGKRKSACGQLCSRPCCSPRSPVHLPRSLFPAQAGNFAPASAVRTASTSTESTRSRLPLLAPAYWCRRLGIFDSGAEVFYWT